MGRSRLGVRAAGFDEEFLALELQDIQEADFDLNLTAREAKL
jgi:hypothetical protein